jgi:putative transposase
MKNFATVFNQFLKEVPRSVFKTCVDKFKGDYRTRVFNCWSQFGAMLYAQLTGKTSLRDVTIGFSNKENYFYHLGVKNVARSTLADANEKRDWRIYEALFHELLPRCQDLAPKHKFRFKNELESLDATTIDLCLASFPWAEFRQKKGAIKVHAKLNHSGQLPNFINITDGKTHEIRVARTLQLEPGSILAIDRAYIKYRWLYEIDQSDSYWVTRLKENMLYTVVRQPEHKLPTLSKRAQKKGVLKDQVIRLTGTKAADLPIELRLVVYQDPETGEVYEYITNIFHLAALTIAEIYKARWDIENFFRWIKQNLKVKTFIGTSENAVRTQIWIAMITYLLLSYIKYKTKCSYTLLEIQRLLRENVFARMSFNNLLLPNSKGLTDNHKGPPLNPNQICFHF